jgi:biopolymer transport protein ExbB/TolQ
MLHTRHEEALGLAQRFAAEQAERLEAARRSLEDRDREIAMLHTRHEEALGLAQRFAAEQAERLEAARRSLEDRDREIATLREALGAMISSLTWRLSRPLRALVTLLSRSPRGKNTEQ